MKKFLNLLITMIFIMVMSVSVFADNIADTNTSNADSIINGSMNDEGSSTTNSESENVDNQGDKKEEVQTDEYGYIAMEEIMGADQVSQEEVEGYVDEKGTDVVNLIRKVALYFTIGCFIIALIYTIVSALGSKGNAVKGIVILVIIGLVFVGIYYAPQILFAFKNYMAS